MGRPRLQPGEHGNISGKLLRKGYARAQAWVCDADGERRLVIRTAPTVAAAKLRVQAALKDRPVFGAEISPDTLFGEVADAWIADIERQAEEGSLSHNTLRLYRSHLDNYVRPTFAKLRCKDIKVSQCEAFMLTVKDRSKALRSMCRLVLSGVCAFAVRHDAMPSNPATSLSQIKSKGKKDPKALTADQKIKWFRFLQNDEQAKKAALDELTALMLATGVRIGEMLAVRIEEIDLKGDTLPITHHMVPIKGQGLVRVESTKSGGDERDLVLPKWAQTIVKRRALALGGHGPLFPTAKGTHRSPNNVARDYRAARERAGLGQEIVTHALRATVLTELYEAGLATKDVADQAGHSRMATTEDHYLGRQRVGDKAAEALEAFDPTKLTGTED